MRNIFPEYYKPCKQELRSLVSRATFSFDACALLDIYRISDESRGQYFSLLEKLKHRLWITHQAAAEFQKNRLTAISGARKTYRDTKEKLRKSFNDLTGLLQSVRSIDSLAFKDRLQKIADDVAQKIESEKSRLPSDSGSDELRQTLDGILGANVGQQYEPEDLKSLHTEAEGRYKVLKPPGYLDATGKPPKPIPDRYGDFIVWRQLMDYGKQRQTPVVFVTSERKEDWWNYFGDDIAGPRPELIKEWAEEVGTDFYMYKLDHLLSKSSEYFDVDATKASDEIKVIHRQDDNQTFKGHVAIKTGSALIEYMDAYISIAGEGFNLTFSCGDYYGPAHGRYNIPMYPSIGAGNATYLGRRAGNINGTTKFTLQNVSDINNPFQDSDVVSFTAEGRATCYYSWDEQMRRPEEGPKAPLFEITYEGKGTARKAERGVKYTFTE